MVKARPKIGFNGIRDGGPRGPSELSDFIGLHLLEKTAATGTRWPFLLNLKRAAQGDLRRFEHEFGRFGVLGKCSGNWSSRRSMAEAISAWSFM